VDTVDSPALGMRALLLLVEDLHLSARHVCRHQHDDIAGNAVLECALHDDEAVLRLLEGEEQLIVIDLARVGLDMREEARERGL